MTPFRLIALTLSLIFTAVPTAFAADSLLAVYCLPGTTGAEIQLDGKAVGNCEDDARKLINISAGSHRVDVVRMLDGNEYEQRFSTRINAPAGQPVRVRAALPEKVLTAYGQKMAAQREAQAKLAEEKAAFNSALAKARDGDASAMNKVSACYEQGLGTAKNPEKAAYWKSQYEIQRNKAEFNAVLANSQNEELSLYKREQNISKLIGYYRSGFGTEVNEEKAKDWEQRLQDLQREQKIAYLKSEIETHRPFGAVLMIPETLIKAPLLGSAFVTISPVATLLEATSSPYDSTDYSKYKKELEKVESQASLWANPDSMIAQAATN